MNSALVIEMDYAPLKKRVSSASKLKIYNIDNDMYREVPRIQKSCVW